MIGSKKKFSRVSGFLVVAVIFTIILLPVFSSGLPQDRVDFLSKDGWKVRINSKTGSADRVFVSNYGPIT